MVLYASQGIDDRRQAYGLLALAAKEHWSFPSLPTLTRAPGGKPRFLSQQGREFNLSHSGQLALCALASAPVGADIQIIKHTWRPTLPNRVCGERELAWLKEQPDFWLSFAALWALKESRVKQNGQGLTVPIRSISIPLPCPGQALYKLEHLWFRLYSGEYWMAAVCSPEQPPAQILWRPVEALPSKYCPRFIPPQHSTYEIKGSDHHEL